MVKPELPYLDIAQANAESQLPMCCRSAANMPCFTLRSGRCYAYSSNDGAMYAFLRAVRIIFLPLDIAELMTNNYRSTQLLYCCSQGNVFVRARNAVDCP